MKVAADIMGMPVNVMIADNVDELSQKKDIENVFSYLRKVDERFSLYKTNSEMSRMNRGEVTADAASPELQEVLALCEQTKRETNGYFDIRINGQLDPSGLVKGWAIQNAAQLLRKKNYRNFFVEIAGDVQVLGRNEQGKKWRVGIQNPFQSGEIIKVVHLENCGIATSGNYERGEHIHNPMTHKPATEIASFTIIGPNVYEADRFATAAFAMGKSGLEFIESRPNLEGYMITKDQRGHWTSGFEKYVENH